jgi:hypothetical protein
MFISVGMKPGDCTRPCSRDRHSHVITRWKEQQHSITMPPTEQQFFAALQCIDDYLGAQKKLGVALKDGLLNIARGKYTLGGALGQQQYPGDMQASVLLQPCPAADEDAIYDEFQLQPSTTGQGHAARRRHSSSYTAQQQHEQQESSSTTAGPAAAPDSGASIEQHSAGNACSSSSSDTLAWFSALPPQPVRQAQSDFAGALQQAVAAANALQRLRQLAADLGLQDEQQDAASDAS